MQQMFQAGQLSKFIDELGQIMWQEKTDKQRWDFWLHRIYSMDFDQYVRECESRTVAAPETDSMDSMDSIETIINNSNDILERFNEIF